MVKRFPCTKCGACCRRAALIKTFPQDMVVDGACKHFKGNECEIYANRPDICRISKNQGDMSLDDYFKLTAVICNMWANMDGMGDQVDPNQFGSDK